MNKIKKITLVLMGTIIFSFLNIGINSFAMENKLKNDLNTKTKDNNFILNHKRKKEDGIEIQKENESFKKKSIRKKTIALLEKELNVKNELINNSILFNKKDLTNDKMFLELCEEPIGIEDIYSKSEVNSLKNVDGKFYNNFKHHYKYKKLDSCFTDGYIVEKFNSMDYDLLKMEEMFNETQALASAKFVKDNGRTITKEEFEQKKNELKKEIEKYDTKCKKSLSYTPAEQRRKHGAAEYLIKKINEMNYDSLKDQKEIRTDIQKEQNTYNYFLFKYIPKDLKEYKEKVFYYLLDSYCRTIKNLIKETEKTEKFDIKKIFKNLKDHHYKWHFGYDPLRKPLDCVKIYGIGNDKLEKSSVFEHNIKKFKECLEKLIDENSDNYEFKLDFEKMLERIEIIEAIIDRCLYLANSFNMQIGYHLMQKVFGNYYDKHHIDGLSSDKEFNEKLIEKLKESSK